MVHVLVVEDDVKLNQIVCSSLNNAGYTAHSCLSAQHAFDVLFDGGIDVIVSDIMMPGVDGFELVSHVRSVNKKIPILLMTARDDIAAKQRGFRAGIDDYMVKPIDVDELLLRIEALLRRARIEAEQRLVIGSTVLD
ncbi:MAG: response regulator transcription factor, partial [Clostridiales bacterium]|nr:response regulator transcription factor [Clostridiales bacterium]